MREPASAPHETAVAPRPTARASEDARLFARYKRTRDQAARDELVARFLPLAKRLARRYAENAEYDDLVQVASFALIKAVDRYDPDRGLAFSTYAVPTIVGELKRYFRDHTWTVRVPRDLHDQALRVYRASDRLTGTLGRSPSAGEIAEALNTSVESVLEALQTVSAKRPDRLDAPSDYEDGEPEGPIAAFEEEGFAVAEASATMAPLLSRLTPREQQILRLRFEHDLTQSEIGALLGISQMHVSRILRRTIAQLQALARDLGRLPGLRRRRAHADDVCPWPARSCRAGNAARLPTDSSVRRPARRSTRGSASPASRSNRVRGARGRECCARG